MPTAMMGMVSSPLPSTTMEAVVEVSGGNGGAWNVMGSAGGTGGGAGTAGGGDAGGRIGGGSCCSTATLSMASGMASFDATDDARLPDAMSGALATDDWRTLTVTLTAKSLASTPLTGMDGTELTAVSSMERSGVLLTLVGSKVLVRSTMSVTCRL